MCVFSMAEVKEVGLNVNVLLSSQCSSFIMSSSGVIFPPVCCLVCCVQLRLARPTYLHDKD